MLLTPDRTIDRGCWISGDRVYAFLSSAANAITEVGFHGPQPPSVNSRVLVDPTGAIRLLLRDSAGREEPIAMNAIDWFASGAAAPGSREEAVVVEAASNHLVIRFLPSDRIQVVRVNKKSLFTEVHGIRTWERGRQGEGWIELQFRDRLPVDQWMERGGVYGGDFLIPEPVRREIFGRKCRSGEATASDLLPEFRDTSFDIYDARVLLRIGGEHFVVTESDLEWILAASGPEGVRECVIEFIPLPVPTSTGTFPRENSSPQATPPSVAGPSRRPRFDSLLVSAPTIGIPGHPATEKFFSTLPSLVASAVVGDWGIPRATPGSYYSIWAWDALVTSLTGLRWGDRSTAAATVEFIDAHRDAGGEIPMRWTGDLLPLDTQPRGALEALLFILADAASAESGDDDPLRQLYPHAVEFLNQIEHSGDSRGFLPNIGFYPDLPLRFGRSHRSAVAIETGAAYSFCRTLETVAHRLGDPPVAERARAISLRIEGHFLPSFWEGSRGFLVDAIDLDTGARNPTLPIFTLLFLCSPLGISLLRPRLDECAGFISRELLTPAGFRTLPRNDPRSGSETISGAWYPHWDQYAVKVLRRCGRADEILLWLRGVERALTLLGSCPEVLQIDPILEGKPGAWLNHGSTSNLNCATGWYSALLEGLFGWEVDRGGVTIVPLALPIGPLRATGIVSRGTRFDVVVEQGGSELEELILDGRAVRGTLKLPVECYDGEKHRLVIRYGPKPAGPRLLELINGEVVQSAMTNEAGTSLELLLRTFGTAEAVVSLPFGATVMLDGIEVAFPASRGRSSGATNTAQRAIFRIDAPGSHRLTIEQA